MTIDGEFKRLDPQQLSQPPENEMANRPVDLLKDVGDLLKLAKMLGDLHGANLGDVLAAHQAVNAQKLVARIDHLATELNALSRAIRTTRN